MFQGERKGFLSEEYLTVDAIVCSDLTNCRNFNKSVVNTCFKLSTCFEQHVHKLLTACFKLVPAIWNKQCEHNLSTACEQNCRVLFADLSQPVRLCMSRKSPFVWITFVNCFSGTCHQANDLI